MWLFLLLVDWHYTCLRGLKDMEQDSSSIEKRHAYRFLKTLLKYVDSAQEFIAHLGLCHFKHGVLMNYETDDDNYFFLFCFRGYGHQWKDR